MTPSDKRVLPPPGAKEHFAPLEDLGEPRYSPWMLELIAAADRAKAAAATPITPDSPPAANPPAAE